MRKEILLAGIGWIAAGAISLAVWMIETSKSVCSCPAIPVNATPAQIAVLCPCATSVSPTGLYIGIFAIVVGVAVLLSSKKIEALMNKYNKDRK